MGLQGFDLEIAKVTRPQKKVTKSQSAILQHYQTLCKKSNANDGRVSPILNLKHHHAWITMYLIQRFTKGGEHILDLACGKGGDLLKWEKAKVDSYVGVDMVECLLEEAKRRYAKSGCTFAAQFLCEDGFGSMLLQALGLESQGDHHHESLLIEETGFKRQSHSDRFLFEALELKVQGVRLMEQASFDRFLFQESSTYNQGYIWSTLMVLEYTLMKRGLTQSLLMKKPKKQNLDASMVVQKSNDSRGMLGITIEGPNGSLLHQHWLGLPIDHSHEVLLHYIEPSKKKKKDHVILGVQKNMMKKAKGVHRSLKNVNESVSEGLNKNVQLVLENVNEGVNKIKMVGTQKEVLLEREKEGQFDVCSCQFALHYAWSSEERAKGAIRNVAKLLKSGGYFFGTIPDAHMVLKRLQEAAINKASCLKETSGDYEGLHFGNKIYNVKFDDVNVARALSLTLDIKENQVLCLDTIAPIAKKPPNFVRNYLLGQNNAAKPPSMALPTYNMVGVKKFAYEPPLFLKNKLQRLKSIDLSQRLAKKVNFRGLKEEKKMRGDYLAPTTNSFAVPVKSFGIEYEFHLEGAVEHCPEWLVPFNSLISLAKQYGLKLVFAANFEEIFSAQKAREQLLLGQNQSSFQQEFLSSQNPLPHGTPSVDELECMSLYLAFAFQKQATPS